MKSDAEKIVIGGQLLGDNLLFITRTLWHFPYSLLEILLARYSQPQSFAPFSMANVALVTAPVRQNQNFNVKRNEHG